METGLNENLCLTGENQEGKDMKFIEVTSFEEAIEKIRNEPPGILLIDSDGTSRNFAEAVKNIKPGLVPEQSLSSINELRDKGWEIAVVTNQPYPGHQVARGLSKGGDRYEAFPFCYEKRGIKVFGGDFMFLTKKYKEGIKALDQVGMWVKEKLISLSKPKERVNVVFVGDRRGDIEFFERLCKWLGESVDNYSAEEMMLKIPGLENSSSLVVRKLARLVP